MHSLIYFSFLILLGVTTTLEIDHQLPESAKFLHGGVYKGFAAVGDIAGLMLVVGVVWAMVRRYGPRRMRPYRIRIKSKPEHAIILGTFLAIALTGFAAVRRTSPDGTRPCGSPTSSRSARSSSSCPPRCCDTCSRRR
jgi:nitrate reductase gamma subunit